MELLVLVSLCILTFTGKSFGDETGLVKIKTDQDVTLPCSFGRTLLDKRINWKKDGKDIFLYENGQVKPSSQDGQCKVRVSHFPDELKSGNASITIKQAKVSDSGTYICLFYEQGATAQSGHVEIKLTVDPPLITIKEDESVILPCSFSPSLTEKRIDWKKDGMDVFLYEKGRVNPSSQDEQFKGRVSNFPDELKCGNASITIKSVKVSDSGNYTCLYLNKDGKEEGRQQIKLTVECILKDRTGKINGTCPKPTIRIIQEVNGGTLVECKARDAFPAPKMELQNRANITIHVGDPEPSLNGEHDYILHAVVTKEDHYRCVVTQDNICHQIYSKETLVPVSSGNDPLIGGMIGCIIVIGVLAVVPFLLYKLRRKRNSSGKEDDKTNGATSPLNE